MLKEYAATCVVVILAKKWTACGLIGDSAAVILNNDNALHNMCPPQKGEYANMTFFLTQDDALDFLCIYVKKEQAKSVAVFSDGLLELSVNITKNIPYQPFFGPLFSFVENIEDYKKAEEELSEFLNSERVNSRTNDDKTLILAGRI